MSYRINVVRHKNSYIGEVLHDGSIIAVTGFCHFALSARKRAGYIVAKLPTGR